uniref:ATP synthase complex subunit 8 n=1 Tax=Deflorita sp. ZJZ-2017 TaxID=1945539 RepID=A0A1Q1MP96_9ORTH|nr:ATP synthase F0 subunit 8 [Deflorita sp. ZJZ-2017]
MPQMSPLWWFLLFLIFSSTLITFNLMNYFIILPQPLMEDPSKSSLPHSSLVWKW